MYVGTTSVCRDPALLQALRGQLERERDEAVLREQRMEQMAKELKEEREARQKVEREFEEFKRSHSGEGSHALVRERTSSGARCAI